MDHPGDSDSSSEVDEQSKAWESDPRVSTLRIAGDVAKQSGCGIGHRVQASRSVLALVLDDECVFAGLQGGDIAVGIRKPLSWLAKAYGKKQAWSLDTYALVLSVHAHKESVLGLYLSEDGELLFSSGGDSVVNVLLATFLLSVSVRITLMPVGVVHQDL
jgi:di- and tripeptidase